MEFPIDWHPDEQSKFWFWDASHWPNPTTPLAATLELPAMAEGFTRACQALHRPFPAYHVKVVNGFVYFGFDLVGDPPERAARVARHAHSIEPLIASAERYWTDDVLPEVRAAADHLRFGEWHARSGPWLAEALAGLYAGRVRMWELHDRVLVPAMAAVTSYLALFARLFPDAPLEDAHALLRGQPNKSSETAFALWRIARDPAVARFAAGDAAGHVPPALREYLDAYGWRTDGWELSDPSLREAPAPLVARLRRYAEPAHPNPVESLARVREDSERRTAEALARLPDETRRRQFTAALTAARAYPVLSEDHNFFIDQMSLTAFRVPLLAMGGRVAEAGILNGPGDVFYLTRDELSDTLRAIVSGTTGGASLAQRVAERRAERTRWQGVRPPATIGVPLPADMSADPLYAGFFGIGAEPRPGGRILRGIAAAPGVAAGPARVVRALADGDRLRPGDILVCPMTSPSWTPLFGAVAAVVADAGGVLSHTAIVAREFGIPCVVATKIACSEITDGEWIEVDGSAGEVRRSL